MSENQEVIAAKGVSAFSLMENEAFTDAVDAVDERLTKLWRMSGSSEERERIWLALDMLGKVSSALEEVMKNGQFAEKHLNEIRGK